MKNLRIKRNLITVTVLGLGLMIFIAGSFSCKNASEKKKNDVTKEDVKSEMKEAVDTTAAYLEESRQEVLRNFEKRIKETGDQISALQSEIISTRKELKQKFQIKIDAMEKKLKKIHYQVEDFRESSEDAEEEIEKGIEEALNKLDESIENATKEFKKSE